MKPNLDNLQAEVRSALNAFTGWLQSYGETSWDHQSFFGGPFGGFAKSLYYRNKLIGTAAVAPMIFFEGFLPSARRLFHQRIRFPIADAHYAMGFAWLFQATNDPSFLRRAVHFLEVLKETRCPQFKEYCWGYPFDWVTRNGTIKQNTPLITTTPYVYEAFLQVSKHDPNPEWRRIIESIITHAKNDIKDFSISPGANSCSYTPYDKGGVINASAYRGFMLTSAAIELADPEAREIARRNINFVLNAQNSDGSWYYAVDGVRDFVDHFHTCFVMKALAKVHSLTQDDQVLQSLATGVEYYLANLFDEEGLPKPYSRAPRMTVYKRELYDCAECINLCLLLRDRFPRLNDVLQRVTADILANWVKPDGSFRARKLHFGWDNVPMHRWAQSQMFRALAFYRAESSRTGDGTQPEQRTEDGRQRTESCAGREVNTY